MYISTSLTRRTRNTDLPTAFLKMDLENVESKEAIELINKYVDNIEEYFEESKGVVISGPSGTYKTFASIYIANNLIEKVLKKYNRHIELNVKDDSQKYHLKFIQATDLLIILKNIANNQSKFEELKKVKVLVIDDLTKLCDCYNESNIFATYFDNFVRGRYNNDNFDIITSQVSTIRFTEKEFFGESLGSVLQYQKKDIRFFSNNTRL